MKGNEQVVEILNEALTHELTAVNQYFIHAKILQDWGYEALGKKLRAESIEEMGHAETLMEKILFFEGVPNMQKLNKVNVGQNVPEMFRLDLQAEVDAYALYNRAVELCRSVGDHSTADLFKDLVQDEEGHIDWLESQLELINQIGAENYLAQHIHEND